MHLRENTPIRFILHALPSRIDKKTAGIAATLAVLILFGDAVFPLLGHGLYLLVELLEQESENLLEFAFGLSTREAQILIVWVGLPAVCVWGWRLSRKPRAVLKARWAAFLNWVNGDWSVEDWFRILALIAVLSAALYFIV